MTAPKRVFDLAKSFYKLRLRTALVISVLPVSIVSYYLTSAYFDLHQYKHYIEKITQRQDVSGLITTDRFRLALRKRIGTDFTGLVSPPPGIHDKSNLKSYYLYVDPEDLAKLNSDLPDSGKEYISGYMVSSQQEKIQRMKLRYRGMIPAHWAYKQKSLRIKLAKGELNQMNRVFNLVNPPHSFFPIDYVSYDISREAGLLTPDSEPVRVFINNEYMGLYSYLSQIDESTLRKNKRMPGSIYYGEPSKYNDKDGVNVLWKHHPSWDKKASRNLEESDDRRDIESLISGINAADPVDFYNYFNQYTDKSLFYTFFGIDTLVGGMHHDYSHNHRLYFSPYKGKFEPIQWDVRFWLPVSAKDAVTYPLLTNVMLNPVLEMERDLVGYQLLNKFPAADIIARLKKYQDQIRRELKNDIFRDETFFYGPHYFSIPFSLTDFDTSIKNHQNIIQERAQLLQAVYEDTEVSYTREYIDDSISHLDFQVTGNSSATIDLADFFPQRTSEFTIYRDINNDRLASDEEFEPASIQTLHPGRKILPGNETHGNAEIRGTFKLRPSPLNYAFIVKNGGAMSAQVPGAINTITRQVVGIETRAAPSADLTAPIPPWKLPHPKQQAITLQGEIVIDEDTVFEAGSDVTIEPGTVFRIAAEKSINFLGRVKAIGTKTRPIAFVAQDKNSPWGSIVVQGSGSDNSEFSFVNISNGSISSSNLINYPGQLNIHSSKGFRLSNCQIGQNHVGDDNLHIANSEVVIEGCIFYQSLRDAVDIDISTVEVSNSKFIESGNDSIDLMTSSFKLANNVFYIAGDKCLSIGEWSKGVLEKNILVGCNTGIAVKDKSHATAVDIIIDSAISSAVSLYNKNPRYDEGGYLRAVNLFLIGNEAIESDDKSVFTIESRQTTYPDLNEFSFLQKEFKHLESWEQLKSSLSELSYDD